MAKRLSSIIAGIHVFDALQSRGFCHYYLGLAASVLSYQMMLMTQMWLVFDISGSPMLLGGLGVALSLPAIAFILAGGTLADRIDQRRLILATQASSGFLMGLLGALVLGNLVEIWHVLTIAFLIGGIQAFDTPARHALMPHLIERAHLFSAVALNSAVWQGMRIVGPAFAGFMIGTTGSTGLIFLVCAIGFFSLAAVTLILRPTPASRSATKGMLASILEVLVFVKNRSDFAFLIGLSFFAAVFGWSFVFMFPIFADKVLGVGASGLGVLNSTHGLGAVLGTVIASGTGRVRSVRPIILGGYILFGISIIGFAVSKIYIISAIFSLLAGLFGSVFVITVMTLIQILVPDEFRGRVMGFYSITWSLIALGALPMGVLASVSLSEFGSILGTLAGAPFAVAFGGAAVVIVAVLAVLSGIPKQPLMMRDAPGTVL